MSRALVDRLLPALVWMRRYNRAQLNNDLIGAVIVTVMLIPQSLAYALLAGLPAETGLYASMLPLVAYALWGTSRTLSVGPVAVISLMTAAAISEISASGLLPAGEAAILLALLSGAMLLLFGLLRCGFLANFLSHPVVSGFITASGLIIALSQLKYLLGIQSAGDNLPDLLHSLALDIGNVNIATAVLGSATLGFLWWARSGLKTRLQDTSLQATTIGLIIRAAPVVAVVVTTLLAWQLDLPHRGVAIVGSIPSGLPSLRVPALDSEVLLALLLPALLLSVIGYVESVSVGRTLAAKRLEKIDPDQELVGLGTANIASALSGGFPVSGSLSRSIINYDAGAVTQAASLFTAVGIGVVTLLLTPWLAWLPHATLAATIIVAVLSLVDFSMLRTTWHYSRSDFAAVAATIVVTLLFGVETGVSTGVLASLVLHLYKTSRPHIAEVGEVAGTGHFRNIARHSVITHPEILSLRVDARLFFANASFIEDEIIRSLQNRKELRHVILMCSAVNEVDISALEVLEAINARLHEMQIGFHLSEIKGPVMDRLQRSDFLHHLNGQVFTTQQQAVTTLLAAGPTASDPPSYQDSPV